MKEVPCNMDFIYVLLGNVNISQTEYKVMQNHENSGLLRCMRLKFNGNEALYYITENYKCITNLITNLDADIFIVIVTNLIEEILKVKGNGFLHEQNIDIDFNKIYVDLTTLKVKLVYFPGDHYLFKDNSLFENVFRTTLIRVINQFPRLNNQKIVQLSGYLASGVMSLNNIYERLKGQGEPTFSAVTSVQQKQSTNKKRARIISYQFTPPIQFDIEKSEYILGRNKKIVDGCINFNDTVSSKHCKIIYQNSQYFLCDLNSTNGTFLNKNRLAPNTLVELHDGDTVRLGNAEFKFEN